MFYYLLINAAKDVPIWYFLRSTWINMDDTGLQFFSVTFQIEFAFCHGPAVRISPGAVHRLPVHVPSSWQSLVDRRQKQRRRAVQSLTAKTSCATSVPEVWRAKKVFLVGSTYMYSHMYIWYIYIYICVYIYIYIVYSYIVYNYIYIYYIYILYTIFIGKSANSYVHDLRIYDILECVIYTKYFMYMIYV